MKVTAKDYFVNELTKNNDSQCTELDSLQTIDLVLDARYVTMYNTDDKAVSSLLDVHECIFGSIHSIQFLIRVKMG